MSESITFRSMVLADIPLIMELSVRAMGSGPFFSDGDEADHDSLIAYLSRNPGLSQVALCDGRIVASLLCGHDGWRGYVRHLAIDRAYPSLGRAILDRFIRALAVQGINECSVQIEEITYEAFAESISGWEAVEKMRSYRFVIEDFVTRGFAPQGCAACRFS